MVLRKNPYNSVDVVIGEAVCDRVGRILAKPASLLYNSKNELLKPIDVKESFELVRKVRRNVRRVYPCTS